LVSCARKLKNEPLKGVASLHTYLHNNPTDEELFKYLVDYIRRKYEKEFDVKFGPIKKFD
jgi:hypothetical protein